MTEEKQRLIGEILKHNPVTLYSSPTIVYVDGDQNWDEAILQIMSTNYLTDLLGELRLNDILAPS